MNSYDESELIVKGHAIVTKMSSENPHPDRRQLILSIFLTILPWLLFWLVIETGLYRSVLLLIIDPSFKPPYYLNAIIPLAPLYVLLITGIIAARKKGFPIWSYTWIGTFFFFVYREVFNIILNLVPPILPQYANCIITGFYFGIVPLALAFMLAIIARRDWIRACFTAYPYTTIIQAWYTLDKNPLYVFIIGLVLYGCFAYLFLISPSKIHKFLILLVATIVIGLGFYVIYWPGFTGFIRFLCRLLLIISFPLILYKIPLYHKLFKTLNQ